MCSFSVCMFFSLPWVSRLFPHDPSSSYKLQAASPAAAELIPGSTMKSSLLYPKNRVVCSWYSVLLRVCLSRTFFLNCWESWLRGRLLLKSSPQQPILASSQSSPGHAIADSFPISPLVASQGTILTFHPCHQQPGTVTMPGFGALCILAAAGALRSVSAPGGLGEGRSLLRTLEFSWWKWDFWWREEICYRLLVLQ